MSSITYDTKNSASLSYDAKNSASVSYDGRSTVADYLLQENGYELLQENEGLIILEQSTIGYTSSINYDIKY